MATEESHVFKQPGTIGELDGQQRQERTASIPRFALLLFQASIGGLRVVLLSEVLSAEVGDETITSEEQQH